MKIQSKLSEDRDSLDINGFSKTEDKKNPQLSVLVGGSLKLKR